MGECVVGASMLALIDGDILVYRVAWASEDVEFPIAKWRLNDLVSRIQDSLEAKNFRIFLTSADKTNFRLQLDSEYKANRTKPKPVHYEDLRRFIMEELDGEMVAGQEADDALGIEMMKGKDQTIVTIDKDLDQIPGWHFNFVKDIKYNMSETEAWRSFYWQVLVGDTGDNVKGCPKIGPVKATRYLEGCLDETEMFRVAVRQYENAYGEGWSDYLLKAGNLLWIRKREGQSWERPNGEVVSKKSLESFSREEKSPSSSSETSMTMSFPQLSEST